MRLGQDFPIIDEWDDHSGGIGMYAVQDLTISRWVHQDAPHQHVDVGSRLDGFVTQVAVFCEVHVLDIREAPVMLDGVIFERVDLLEPLAPKWRGTVASLSCLHSIEHFGLGRYGDRLDPDGHLRGLEQLMAMVSAGGRLYFSCPVGDERVEFNAHRILDAGKMLAAFDQGWVIERVAMVREDRSVIHLAASSFSGKEEGILMFVARKESC